MKIFITIALLASSLAFAQGAPVVRNSTGAIVATSSSVEVTKSNQEMLRNGNIGPYADGEVYAAALKDQAMFDSKNYGPFANGELYGKSLNGNNLSAKSTAHKKHHHHHN